MASIMIHLAVAYRLAQSEGFCSTAIRDRGSYYLGAVAPDAVNMDGFAPKALRWAAHRREKTVKEWYHSIAGFWKTHLQNNRINPDLLLGYVVHILTDAAFDETLHNPIWAAAAKAARLLGEPSDEKEEGWNECYRFDRSQLSSDWWTKEVRPALSTGKPENIGTIPVQLLSRYQADLLESYPRILPTQPPRVITLEMVWLLGDYVETVMQEIWSEIRKNENGGR